MISIKDKNIKLSGVLHYMLIIGLSFSSLLMGGLIYALLRQSKPIFFKWINSMGLSWLMNLTRTNITESYRFLFPEWFVYSLPDGLWAFSYSLIIIGLWWKSNSVIKYFWICTIPVLIFGYEILQLFGKIKGTFCFQDLVFGAAGIILGYIIGIKLLKQ